MERPNRPGGHIQPKHRVSGEPPPEIRPHEAHERPATKPASEIKELVSCLQGFTMDELEEVPVVVAEARLEDAAVYVDLTDDERSEFVAAGDMTARPGHYLVPKKGTPPPYWNRIIGAQPGIRRQ